MVDINFEFRVRVLDDGDDHFSWWSNFVNECGTSELTDGEFNALLFRNNAYDPDPGGEDIVFRSEADFVFFLLRWS